MRYGIDLDGVLADFGEQVVKVGNKLWPGKFPKGYVPDNWNYEGYLTKDEWAAIWTDIKATPHFWEDLEPLPGLVDLGRAVNIYPKFRYDEIYFITARASTVGESPMVQSSAWLSEAGLWPRRGRSAVIAVADSKDKAGVFKGLGLKFHLDDYAPTVTELNAIDRVQAYVLDQPWNRYASDLPRVYSVQEYLNIVHER